MRQGIDAHVYAQARALGERAAAGEAAMRARAWRRAGQVAATGLTALAARITPALAALMASRAALAHRR